VNGWRWTEDRWRTDIVRERKVRAPLGREVDNADPGRPEGKRNRKDTADGGRLRSTAQVRVKPWGKSPRATAG